MKILVTGGAGFIGSHTVEGLLADGATVTVLDNFSNGQRSNLPAHGALTIVEADVRDAAGVDAALAGVERVLHLAAQVSVQSSVKEPVASCAHNVVGFLNVLDGARRRGIRRVVYASSAAVYGTPAELPLSESSRTGAISPYGLEKLIDDQYAALYASLYGMSTLGLRYFNVFGPRQDPRSPYAGVISKFVDAVRTGQPVRIFGDGLQTRDFVYVKDIAEANRRALASDARGHCNVGTGRTVTLLELVAALERVGGRTVARQFEPPASGDIRDSATSTARLAQALGFIPQTPLETGLSALFG